MTFLDFLKPVAVWSPAQLQAFLDSRNPATLQLVDIRQAAEYQTGHLPGARHIPVGELEERLAELDPALPTVVYCGSGLRSRAAATVLAHAGFAEVYHLAGGLHSWHGGLAEGLPDAELERFRRYQSPAEQVALAWYLEAGACRFYGEVAGQLQDAEAVELFHSLEEAEDQHQVTLVAIYEALTGQPAPADFPAEVIGPPPDDGLMEGGWTLLEVLDWARGRPVPAILELAMAMETNAFDHYLFLARELADENARRSFEVMAGEERRHLKQLAAVLDQFL